MSKLSLEATLQRSLQAHPTYPEVGATQAAVLDAAALPAGYGHLRFERFLGSGVATFVAASQCVFGWQMHRGAGLAVRPSEPRADVGGTVVLGVGVGPLMLHVPCRVVWSREESYLSGFGYATLPGHPETGEEAFAVVMDPAGSVHLRIVAFSRPGRWYTRLTAPAVPLLQRAAVHRYAHAVQRTL